MKIIITSTAGLTPAFEMSVQKKFVPLAKFIKHFEERGEAEVLVEVGRTTRHHRKGDVFTAVASVRLGKKVIRAEESAEDMSKAIDRARDTLRVEIEKYKTKLKPQRGGKE